MELKDKKEYLTPELDVYFFKSDDIIVTSGGDNEAEDGWENGWY